LACRWWTSPSVEATLTLFLTRVQRFFGHAHFCFRSIIVIVVTIEKQCPSLWKFGVDLKSSSLLLRRGNYKRFDNA
jgi:hypothetical protein